MRNVVIEVVINIALLFGGIVIGSKIGTDIAEKKFREQMIQENCAYYDVHTGEFTIGAPVVGPQD